MWVQQVHILVEEVGTLGQWVLRGVADLGSVFSQGNWNPWVTVRADGGLQDCTAMQRGNQVLAVRWAGGSVGQTNVKVAEAGRETHTRYSWCL